MQVIYNLAVTFFLLLSAFNAQSENWDSLYDHAQYQNAKISPDGKYIATAVNHENNTVLLFFKREDLAMVGSAKLAGNYEVGNYHWVNSERVVIDMVKRVPWHEQPQFYGELFAVNYDGSRAKLIYGYKAGNLQRPTRLKRKKSISGWASIIDILPEDDRHILIKSTPMSATGERLSSVFMLNVYTGIINKELGKAPIPFSHFLTDTKGEVKAVVGTDSKDKKQLYLKKNGQWEKVPDGTVSNSVSLISISSSGKYLYTRDNHNQDLFGIFKLNMENFSYENIYTDKNVDVTDVKLTADGRSLYSIRIDDGYPAYLLLNKEIEEALVFKSLLQSFPYNSINITSKSEDGKLYIIMVTSDIDPGSLYLYDKEKNKIELLFKFKPQIKNDSLIPSEPIQVTATDGSKINGYFTQAKNKNNAKLAPVVVVVHGGPHGVRDYWRYSNNVQYLALHGYSVLQVNYRGSGGYGEKYEIDGHRVWGSKIQQDIYESYQWLVDRKKAEMNNVCIMGGSFGAYSAVQSTTLYPDTYKCAIANAGIYDLELMFEEGDIRTRSSGLSYLNNVLGNDSEQLKAMSPVNYASKIKVPLLLAHGKDDNRAPFEHAKRLRDALDEAGTSYEWLAIEKEGHGFYNPENQKAYMRKVVDFLSKHLK